MHVSSKREEIAAGSVKVPVKDPSGGCFVTIEGLDGSGGTTQVAMLAAAWARREPGRELVTTREPTDGPVGRLIRAQLVAGGGDDRRVGDAVLPYLFAADRRDHLDYLVLPALARGAVVLSDRYALSSFAYQAAAHGLAHVMELNRAFPAPTLTVLLDLPPEACLARIERRGAPRDRFETLDRLATVAAGYEAALRASPGWNVLRVDASASPEAVHARIAEAIWPG